MTVINIPNSFAQYHKKPGLVLEGGLYGHMGHIYEDHEMQFETLNNMVLGLLSGEIDGDELFDSLDQLRGQFNLLALQLENLIELGSHELPHPGQ